MYPIKLNYCRQHQFLCASCRRQWFSREAFRCSRQVLASWIRRRWGNFTLLWDLLTARKSIWHFTYQFHLLQQPALIIRLINNTVRWLLARRSALYQRDKRATRLSAMCPLCPQGVYVVSRGVHNVSYEQSSLQAVWTIWYLIALETSRPFIPHTDPHCLG